MPCFRPLLLVLGLLPVASPAAAQRLPYAEMLDAPSLPYDIPAESAASAAPAPAAAPRQGKWLQYGLLDRFEWTAMRGGDGYAWDFSALVGGERNRVYVDFGGDGLFSGGVQSAELDMLYSRAVGGDWDLNAGLRYDSRPHPSRLYATLGAQYNGETSWLGGFATLSQSGVPGARLTGYTSFRIVGPLRLQPSFDVEAAARDMPALGIGRGFTYAEGGLRLRYEIRAAFAPYVGVSWARDLGRTARLDRAAGDDPETRSLVLGLHSEF
ncbi:MAG: copper resistance family protein [Alphaproteobacteria bacterium]|nr:copper resistance family protein [Alphaproteobacteria bacterium]